MYLSDDQKRFGHLPKMRQRRHNRDPICYNTVIGTDSDSAIDIRVTNLSPSGFCARSDARFERGTCIRVQMPTLGEVEGYVAWSLAGSFGAHFTRDVGLTNYPHLLTAIKSA